MKSGAVVANGTDAPVEDVDPIAGFYATVSRKTKDGSVFYPDQRMRRDEALKSYTLERRLRGVRGGVARGRCSRASCADVTVLSKDILTVPEDEIPTARRRSTRSSGGKVRYER